MMSKTILVDTNAGGCDIHVNVHGILNELHSHQ